jgi:hypothetical protein
MYELYLTCTLLSSAIFYFLNSKFSYLLILFDMYSLVKLYFFNLEFGYLFIVF